MPSRLTLCISPKTNGKPLHETADNQHKAWEKATRVSMTALSSLLKAIQEQVMSDNTHTDDSAVQPDYRLVVYPHPATGKPAEDAPVVQFPSPAEMSEEDFHKAAAQAWPQLLADFVGKNYPPEGDHGYIDTLVKHILDRKMDQAEQYARGWQDGRKAS